MEWSAIADILGVGASVASGGLFGLISSGISAWFKVKQRREDRLWKKEEWDHEERLLNLQKEVSRAETENEIDLVATHGSWASLDSSIQHDATLSRGTSKWIRDLRALFRPFLTTFLWVIAGWVFYLLIKGELNEYFNPGEATDIVRYMVYTVFFTASTATVWWYGDRALTPPEFKHH